MKERVVFRVNDTFDVNNLNKYLSDGWVIVNAYIMPFETVVVPHASMTTTKTLGGYIDYILEREEDEESTTVSTSGRSPK